MPQEKVAELQVKAGRKVGSFGTEPGLQDAAEEYRHLPEDGVLLGGTPEAEARRRERSGWPSHGAAASEHPTLATVVRVLDQGQALAVDSSRRKANTLRKGGAGAAGELPLAPPALPVEWPSVSDSGSAASIPAAVPPLAPIDALLQWMEASGAAVVQVSKGKGGKPRRREPRLFLQLRAGCCVDDDAEFSGSCNY